MVSIKILGWRKVVQPGARDENHDPTLLHEYAEVFADGVRPSNLSSNVSKLSLLAALAEAQAASLTSFAQQAKASVGEFGKKASSKNACKSAHAVMNKWGLG